jgi:hypothetical protein
MVLRANYKSSSVHEFQARQHMILVHASSQPEKDKSEFRTITCFGPLRG